MTHASRETLVAYADGELAEQEERHTGRHLEDCAECAAELAAIVETRAHFTWAIARIDEAEPSAWDAPDAAERVLAAAAAGADSAPAFREPAIDLHAHRIARATRPAPVSVKPHVRPTAFRWAAGLVLVAGAAAAAIVTPVIVERVFTEPVPAETRTSEDVVTSSGAVAVLPVDGAVSIALTGAVDGTHVLVAFEQRQDVIVDYSAPETPGFTARDGVVGVNVAGTGTMLRVSVPADVREARVLVDGVEAALLARGEIVRTRPDLNIMIEVSNTGR